jgi:hypothetical protein
MHLGSKFQELNAPEPLDKRVDATCVLGGGVILNHCIVNGQAKVDGIASAHSVLMGYPTENALLLWYLLFSRFVLQAQSKAINLQAYVPNGFTY